MPSRAKYNRIQKQQNKNDVLPNVTENKLNTIRKIKNTSCENIKTRIGKQYNRIPNLILARVITLKAIDSVGISVIVSWLMSRRGMNCNEVQFCGGVSLGLSELRLH